MIINDPLKFPDSMSREAHDLIERLLDKNPQRRLGSGQDDVDEIKRHVFFAPIDWEALLQKQIEAPWKPTLTSDADISHFDREFTREAQGVSFEPPPTIDGSSAQFDGFTYAPEEKI
jgi:serine/threonine protein kinase